MNVIFSRNHRNLAWLLPALLLLGPGRAAGVRVTDFGAKGDGATDDTEAIRAAMKAASIFVSQESPVGCYYQISAALVFPAGEYLISDEIPITTLEIQGEGRAVIRQKDPEKNCFTGDSIWRLAVRNLTFLGGKNPLDLANPNLDTGQILIDHCRFYGAAGFGIRNAVQSTTIKIQDCEFIQCMQAWCNQSSDQAVMRDCWISTSVAMQDAAAIEHRSGRMTIENLVGVPMAPGRKQRWIDNYGQQLSLKQCRFGGEYGGITAVYNYTKYIDSPAFGQNSADNSIYLDNCLVCAHSTPEGKVAVYCLELPNLIRIQYSSLGFSGALALDPKIDLRTYFRNVDPGLLHYSIEGNTGPSVGALPEGLVRPVVTR